MNTERYSGEAYRSTLAQRLRRIPDKQVRREHLELVKESQRDGQKYTDARAAKMIYSRDARAERSMEQTLEPEPELTPQEIKTREIINWAEDLHTEYAQRAIEHNLLPQNTKKDRDRARQYQRQTDRLVQLAASESLGDFDRFDTALGVWRSKDMELPDSEPESSFYSQVVKQMELETRQEWKKFSHEQIAELIKRRAHLQLSTDASNLVLHSYFEAGKNPKENMDALYNLAYATLDLQDDQKSFHEGILMMNFQSDIIPLGSRSHKNVVHAANSFGDDVLLKKGLTFEDIAGNLIELVPNVESDVVFTQKKQASQILGREINWEQEFRKWSSALGRKEVMRRRELFIQFSQANIYNRLLTVDAKVPTWPQSLIYQDDNELHKRFRQEIEPISIISKLSKTLNDEVKKENIAISSTFNIRTPEGFQINVFTTKLTPNLIKDRQKIIEQIASRWQNQDTHEGLSSQGEVGVPIVASYFTHEGVKVFYTIRPATLREADIHPIFALQELGMPTFNPEEVTDSSLSAQEQADFIRENQIRFLNKRGVRFKVEQPQLKELGYDNIQVRRNPQDSNRMIVDINAAGFTYTVGMDQNYNFDLEGRKSDNNEFRESLRYIVLRWLNPVLCKPTDEIKESRESYERQIYSRMGHLRLLPETQHYSEEQVGHCLAFENKDLRSLNAQRKLMLNTERETTYVRPVSRNEDNLPPINITITDEELFRTT